MPPTPSTPSDPPGPTFPREADDRSLWIPVVLVGIALLSALAGPLTIRLLEQRMDRAMQTVIMPARDLVVARRIETQRGIAANAGFLASGNPQLRRRASESTARAAQMGRRLPPLIARLGPETRAEYAGLMAQEQRMAALRPSSNPTREELARVLPLLEARQDSITLAMERLDQALQREVNVRRRRMNTISGWTNALTAALSVLSLAAIVSVTRLTRRAQRARAQAEAAVRARDEVVSIVSHDLRNPLNTIGMATTLLMEDLPAGDPKQKFLGIIERAGATMNRIIQDLLDIARIESGRLSVEPEPVRPAALLSEAAEMLGPLAEKNGQRFACEAR